MPISQKIESDLKEALKSKDEFSASVIRMLKAVIKNKEIEKKEELSDEEVVLIVQKEIKKRKEAKELYEKGERKDLADKEEKEVSVLGKYAPKAMSQNELEDIIKNVIVKTEASSKSEMGIVMKEAMKEVGGRADGKEVSSIVSRLLE